MPGSTISKPTPPRAPALVSVKNDTSPSQVEALLKGLLCAGSDSAEITLSRNLNSGFFVDTWVSILIGTAARHFSELKIKDWMKYHDNFDQYNSYVLSSIPAITSVSLGTSFQSLDGQQLRLNRSIVANSLCNRRLPLLDGLPPLQDSGSADLPLHIRGMLQSALGQSNTVCEFDPDNSLADLFSGGEYPLHTPQSQALFRRSILTFRRYLEFGVGNRRAFNRQLHSVEAGPTRSLTDFLMELHENSHDYGHSGKPSDEDGTRPNLSGVRFLRLKKYVGDKTSLLRRANGLPPLETYLETTLRGKQFVVVEASVSDFGLGIIDFIRTSTARRWYEGRTDRELLALIFNGRATSRVGDPAAGAGIYKALDAARKMAGFVSLRTGENWLQRGFGLDDQRPDLDLEDMLPETTLGKAAGTHWLFLYHQNIDS